MFYLFKNIKAFRSASDNIGEYMASKVGDIHAMAGISLRKKHVIPHPAKMTYTIYELQ